MKATAACAFAAVSAIGVALAQAGVAPAVLAQAYRPAPSDSVARPPDLIGMARANHRTTHVTLQIPARQSHVTEIAVRSGSLSMTLQSIEITFADGSQRRIAIDDTLRPGHASRAIPVDSQRTVRTVSIVKRPGLMPGETVIQLLGRVVPAPETRPSLR
ncbi:hypothetical protein [Hyphomicrobium sp.]|uniref:hypothetical protein n=1 Tax=Hyphomicrobium sp. TaxID=82 RepID=UPI002E2F1329|nr:hypothetical protein [Hyphomicrobium sp.]HEX2841740.1 hypothetical protein [Hyphomicrobium sp.]